MSAPPLNRPVPLEKHHNTAEFTSGAAELDDWLRNYAWVNHQSGNARVFVATRADRVVGYYALATGGVEKAEAPEELLKGGVPVQMPCLLLARLAVDRSERNRGLGKGLLVDAIRRAVRVSDEVGVRALLIHARDEEAKAFYLHQAEFVPSPTDPLHLFLVEACRANAERMNHRWQDSSTKRRRPTNPNVRFRTSWPVRPPVYHLRCRPSVRDPAPSAEC